MWKEITLIAKATKTNEKDGFSPVFEEKETSILADCKKATRTEYYKALKARKQASAVFRMWKTEFEEAAIRSEERVFMPSALTCEGERYEIGREYSADGSDYIELTCKKVM